MTQRAGTFARLRGLIHGMFAGWVRQREERSPRAVYEHAIGERVAQYRELKEAVAGILYMRNRLEAEICERRGELARTLEDIRRAVSRVDDETSLALITRKQSLLEDLRHSEEELAGIRDQAEEAKANLVQFREEIRTLEREKGRMLATLANARARRHMRETLEGLSVDADMRALDVVREHILRLNTEGEIDSEVGPDQALGGRLRSIREEARRDAARLELDEIKRRRSPATLPGPIPETQETALPISS